MAATWTTNISLGLDNEYCEFIECCNTIGAYIIKVTAEAPEGANAIFHIASANDGQKSIKKTVSTAGSNGEQLHIVWQEDKVPILCYLNPDHALEEDSHYTLKII